MTIVEKILREFPNFKDSEFYSNSENLPYVFIPFFADYMTDIIKKNNDEFGRIVTFINDIYNAGNDGDRNQLWIGIFEVCGNKSEIVNIFRQSFTDLAKSDFEKFLAR